MLLTVGFLPAFVSELWQTHSQWLLQHHLIPSWMRGDHVGAGRQIHLGAESPEDAARPCSSTARIQPHSHSPHPPLCCNRSWIHLQKDCRTGILWSKTPKAPGDAAGVLVLSEHLWSPSEAELWQLACPAAPALGTADLHWGNEELHPASSGRLGLPSAPLPCPLYQPMACW